MVEDPTQMLQLKIKGNVITQIEEQLKRWKEHFEEVLNRPPATNPPNIEGRQVLNIKTGNITKTKVNAAIKQLNNEKAAGIDNIPPEAIKAMDNICFDKLHQLLNKIWNDEHIPEDWRKEILVKLQKKGDKSICSN
ncbi:uncharacterized protein [Mytilus edulis]|uniref:uncharacterized protein n=1 Tax=Mytilus edulis TaxID=6550 RepID=UPI0039F114D5